MSWIFGAMADKGDFLKGRDLQGLRVRELLQKDLPPCDKKKQGMKGLSSLLPGLIVLPSPHHVL